MVENIHRFLELPEELQEKVVSFVNDADKQWQQYWESVVHAPQPKYIYHYTDDKGLLGILESGELWLTDLSNLNDPSELSYGFKMAVDLLKSKVTSLELQMFYEVFASMMKGGLDKSAHYFAACFSKEEDDLAQWRSYADQGRGFVLGFDRETLENAFGQSVAKDKPTSHHAFSMAYEAKDLLMHLNYLVGRLVLLILDLKQKEKISEIDKNYLTELGIQLSAACIRLSINFKHPAYDRENEYRFLQVQSSDNPIEGLKLRVRPYSLIKYTSFNWKEVAKGSLKKIIIGPAADKNKSFKFAYDCLGQYYHEEGIVEVVSSTIPFRNIT